MTSLGFASAAWRLASLLLVMSFSHVAVAQEKPFGSNIDARTTLWFKVPAASVGKFLPDGWASDPVEVGPFKGANATVVLIDSYVASDAKGQPIAPFHGFVLGLPARKAGGQSADNLVLVYGIASEEQAPGAYGVYAAGKQAIERTSQWSTDAGMTVRESWQFTAKDGNELEVILQFKRGATRMGKLTGRTVSGARPSYYHVNHIDQAIDLVRSSAMGIEHVEKLSFRATGPKLSQIFNAAELVGIGSVPVFSRTITASE